MNRRVWMSLGLAVLWLVTGLIFLIGLLAKTPQSLEQHRWMGSIALLMAAWNCLRAWLQRTIPPDDQTWP